jgi:glycosyltransferase involved in cell wall biosynthesis
LPLNSGCYLRALYLAGALERQGRRVKLITPVLSKPFMLDFFLNFVLYCFHVLLVPYRTGVAVKPYPNALLPLLVKKWVTGNRVVADIDDVDFGYRQGLISAISRFIQRPFPRFADRVTYHNPLLKDFIKKEYCVQERRLLVLKQGVDLSLFRPGRGTAASRRLFREQHRISPKTRVLVYAAHLNIASDLEEVLRALRPLLGEKAFLIIAGGGPLLTYYQKLARELCLSRIFFTGYLAPSKIARYALLSDFALVYYKDKKVNHYRSSMKLRELLAMEKKVICNDVGELKLFEKYTYQSKSDIGSFVRLIRKLVEHAPRDAREKKGAEFVRTHYDWKKIAQEFLSALDKGV